MMMEFNTLNLLSKSFEKRCVDIREVCTTTTRKIRIGKHKKKKINEKFSIRK